MTTWKRALVTGPTAGIGREIARQLAADHVDLVLVARRADRLEELRAELSGVEVEVVVADLAKPDDLERVAARLALDAAPIDLLVNNAGYGTFGNVWELSPSDAQGQIDVNVSALVRLSHAAATHMVAAGHGTILNISSIAGNQPGPRNAVYGATKAFVTSFSEALAVELRGTGVKVTASCPGFTRTEFHEVAGLPDSPMNRANLFWMTADAVARDALRAAANGKVVRVNGFGNRVAAGATTVMPRALKRFAAHQVTSRLRPAD